jgi:REP element-mobilizing transposase RayT
MKQRKTQRLKDYDYTKDNEYFVTVCTKDHQSLFGEIVKGNMLLNVLGESVKAAWIDLPNHYQNVVLDEYVVMPNHFHGILIIDNSRLRADLSSAPTERRNGLSEFIRSFKSFSMRKINTINDSHVSVWQRGYYERIIRNQNELKRIREYIINNPLHWDNDEYNKQ